MEASSEFSADGYNINSTNHFTVDDLLNFPQEDNKLAMTDGLFFEPVKANSVDSSTATAVDSCNSSVSGGDTTHFNGSLSGRSFTDVLFPGGELCVPYDDLAELEWLSNFVEESFSSDDMHNLDFIPTTAKPPPTTTPAARIGASRDAQPSLPILPSKVYIPGKARSKRPRAAPCDWSSRLLLLSPATSCSENNQPNNHFKQAKKTQTRKREITDTPGRKCLHCASEKTPQWRSGPMGPKSLCNACGVRYKSGRLVAEYRPASSPTFVSAKHSNSHRKVLEMRRQNEMQREQPYKAPMQLLRQNGILDLSNGGDDYLIPQPQQMNGHDFSRMI